MSERKLKTTSKQRIKARGFLQSRARRAVCSWGTVGERGIKFDTPAAHSLKEAAGVLRLLAVRVSMA